MGKESSGTALTVPATGLPVGEQGKEYGKTPTAPMRATEGAPEGFSWSGAVAVPALGSSCRVSMEEQAGGMPAESRRWEVAPTILDVSRNSREGFSSDVDVSQYREGGPPGVGSVALPGLRQDAPSRHSYQRGQMPGLHHQLHKLPLWLSSMRTCWRPARRRAKRHIDAPWYATLRVGWCTQHCGMVRRGALGRLL